MMARREVCADECEEFAEYGAPQLLTRSAGAMAPPPPIVHMSAQVLRLLFISTFKLGNNGL